MALVFRECLNHLGDSAHRTFHLHCSHLGEGVLLSWKSFLLYSSTRLCQNDSFLILTIIVPRMHVCGKGILYLSQRSTTVDLLTWFLELRMNQITGIIEGEIPWWQDVWRRGTQLTQPSRCVTCIFKYVLSQCLMKDSPKLDICCSVFTEDSYDFSSVQHPIPQILVTESIFPFGNQPSWGLSPCRD